jgi:ferrous iron transport protein B
MVKIQTGQIRWMMFSMIFPIVLGIAVATLIFSGGTFLELSGLQAMFAFYGLALAITIGTGFLKNKQKMT